MSFSNHGRLGRLNEVQVAVAINVTQGDAAGIEGGHHLTPFRYVVLLDTAAERVIANSRTNFRREY